MVPIWEKAVFALKKQESILQSVQELPGLNASVIPDLAGDYLSSAIDAAVSSVLSGKE